MKKQISLLVAVLATATLVASTAYAETGTIEPGGTINVVATSGGAAPTAPDMGCVVLSSNVKVGTSANVYGGFECRAATTTQPAAIGVGTCHKAGLAKPRTYVCTGVNLPVTGCTGAALPVAGIPGTGAAYFVAATTGGSVAAVPLNDACDAGAKVVTKVTAYLTSALTAAVLQ